MKFAIFGVIGCAFAATTEIMVLFDVTRVGLRDTDMPTLLADALAAIGEDDVNTSFSVAHFADKPTPYNGIGSYGGFPGMYAEDWCYELALPFTKDMKQVRETLTSLPAAAGLDEWEAHFEALIRGVIDTQAGWTEDAEKIVLMVSDSYGHSSILDTLAASVTAFNEPVRCKGTTTAGGFGAITASRPVGGWVANEGTYNQYAQLHYTRACVEDLAPADQAKYDELRASYPIRTYPSVQPFNLDIMKSDPDTHCRYHEYPSYEEVVEVLSEQNVKFFLVYADPSTAAGRATTPDVWNWVLNDAIEGIAKVQNVFSEISDLSSLKALASPTDLNSPPSSLEAILRSGIQTLTKQ